MDDSIQDNIEYIFDYQTKLSYDLPLNTIQLFEIDLSSSILNNDSSVKAINNVQEALSKGFRKLFVSVTWDNEENNWKICHQDKKNNKTNSQCAINYNGRYSILNLVKSIRKWLDNTNDCNVVILIFQINSIENFDKEKTISCMNGYMEKLEILKRDIISEIKDIIYTVDMMNEGIFQGKKYEERGHDNISYTNGNWISFKKLCSMNKKLLIGLESNDLLCQQYKDNILFTDSRLIKKLVQYQDLKKYVLFSTPKLSKSNNRIDKVLKLVEKRKIGNETSFDNLDIDNNNLSVVFTHDDIINIKKEVIDLINDNNMSIHLKTFDLNLIQLLKNSLIWSWDINTNFMDESSNSCVVINRVTGYWEYHDCNDDYPMACRNINNPLMWSIKLNNETCGDGFTLSLPRSCEENNMLLKTLQYNETLNAYNYFYLTMTPIEVNDDFKPDKRESVSFNTHTAEKHLIVPTDLEYTELLEELMRTSLRPVLMVLIIVFFLIIKSIHKQYVTFKKRRRRMDIKKRLKVIETQTVPI